MTRVRTVGLIWGMVLGIVLTAGGAALAEAPSKAAATCKWSDVNKLKTHVQKHITYPADGKAVKAACKKEMPDEFSKEERACFESKVDDSAQFKSAADVLKLLGVD